MDLMLSRPKSTIDRAARILATLSLATAVAIAGTVRAAEKTIAAPINVDFVMPFSFH